MTVRQTTTPGGGPAQNDSTDWTGSLGATSGSGVVYLEPGSATTKFAFTSNYLSPPSIMVPSALRKRQDEHGHVTFELAQTSRSNQLTTSELTSSVKNGHIHDESALAFLWGHVLKEGLSLASPSVILVIPSSWSLKEKQVAARILMESCGVASLLMFEQSLACLYGAGVTTGVVLDIGHETTDITPIVDNVTVRHACFSIPVGGRHVEAYLAFLLQEKGITMPPEALTKLKESGLCTCVRAADSAEKLVEFTYNDTKFHIPSIVLSACTDILFDASLLPAAFLAESQPSLFSSSSSSSSFLSLSLPHALALSIQKATDPDRRTALWDALLLTGSSSLFPGLEDRLASEVSAALLCACETSNEHQPKDMSFLKLPAHFKDFAPTKCVNCSFIGASFAAKTLFTSEANYLTAEEWKQRGPLSVKLKF